MNAPVFYRIYKQILVSKKTALTFQFESVTNLDLIVELHVGVEYFTSPCRILLIDDLDDFEALLRLGRVSLVQDVNSLAFSLSQALLEGLFVEVFEAGAG